MTAPAFDEIQFDDSDGAYAVAEPDPFAELAPAPEAIPARSFTPSLRVELGATPAAAIQPGLPPLPVPAGLAEVLPHGLRRGSTIAVTGSVSLLLALLGGPSAQGAWTAMVGMPPISAEAAVEAGIDLSRLAVITPPEGSWTGASWTTAVGALLDAVDVVVARPGYCDSTNLDNGKLNRSSGITDSDARRLTARARGKDAVLVLFGQRSQSWPAVEVRLHAKHGRWTGIGDGYGRLAQRQLLVSATGRGRSARPRSTELWL